MEQFEKGDLVAEDLCDCWYLILLTRCGKERAYGWIIDDWDLSEGYREDIKKPYRANPESALVYLENCIMIEKGHNSL